MLDSFVRDGSVDRPAVFEAFARRLPMVDLRLICDEDADYANPIEPSVQSGRKIAAERR